MPYHDDAAKSHGPAPERAAAPARTHRAARAQKAAAGDPAAASHLLAHGSRLLREARRDCAREGVQPDTAELIARAAARAGMPLATAAPILSRLIGEVPSARSDGGGNVSSLEQIRANRRLAVLAEAILGWREQTVFLARCLTGTGTGPSVPPVRLARILGCSPERVAAIEASARRKIAAPAWADGLADAIGHDVVPAPGVSRSLAAG
jgi:hypothetical protein